MLKQAASSWHMDAEQHRRIAKLAQVEDHIALERQHVIDRAAQLEEARGLDWAQSIDQAQDLLDLYHERLARLAQERADLLSTTGSTSS
jgi:hypothetical protein